MKLSELAALMTVGRLIGDGNVEITGLSMDSRTVKPGDLFLCVPGHPNLIFADRHQFAADAVGRGAAALLVERELDIDVPQLLVSDVPKAMARISAHFYRYPSLEMKVIGVTGTNGKTTTTQLIEHILRKRGHRTASMGNLGMRIGDAWFESDLNTQQSHELQRSFRQMRDAGTEYCLMEVSSHGLALGRVLGTRFRTAVFTNLTQDHLDFHLTMEGYREAKGLFFSRLGNDYGPDADSRQYAVLNADDPASEYFAGITAADVVTYGIHRKADVRAEQIRMTAEGTEFRAVTFAGEADVRLRLFGMFNVYNALGAIAATLLEGVPLAEIVHSLESMKGVSGRMEPVSAGQPFLVLVDYAHTPDSLENVLATIKQFAEKRIITVFGCGGDRDRTKRPAMGNIAARYSDFVFVTSDNPRTEDPLQILHDIEPGLLQAGLPRERYAMIVNRREAIRKAVEMASPGDVVLIAGKGHETYQEINREKHHFDDREEALAAIRGIIH